MGLLPKLLLDLLLLLLLLLLLRMLSLLTRSEVAISLTSRLGRAVFG